MVVMSNDHKPIHDQITSNVNRKIPKGTVLDTLQVQLLIPFWKNAAKDDDDIYHSILPGYQRNPAVAVAIAAATDSMTVSRAVSRSDELGTFLEQLFHDESFEALVMFTTMELALRKNNSLHQDDYSSIATSNLGILEDTSLEESSFLVEGWPVIQEYISWKDCCMLYRHVHSRLHMVTLPHPLTDYAKQILFKIPDDDFGKAVRGAARKKWIPEVTFNRLKASQYVLDYVASLPPRKVGILLHDRSASSENSPILVQSCLPSATIELTRSSERVQQCSLIALYDMNRDSTTTVSTRPPSVNCICPKCEYGRIPVTSSRHFVGGTKINIEDTKRLAHALFLEEEKFDEAKELYHVCHDAVPLDSQEERAELWHAMGAIELTRNRFVKAQQHWRDGTKYADIHSGIALQLEKQAAYEYWNPLPSPDDKLHLMRYETIAPRSLFVTPNAVSIRACQDLIKWAEEFGRDSTTSGWTTSRHYAVPTNDIPVHQAPKILNWFQKWIKEDVQPLLRQQFQTTQRFYVHDAFMVRYSASYESRFLPLHYDESTHSMVLALNDDFEGGGTYVYNLDKTMSAGASGSLVSFRGNQLLHGGSLVTKGIRYILAAFLYLDDDTSNNVRDDYEHSFKRRKVDGQTQEGFSFDFF